MNKTVEELTTGQAAPLSLEEWTYWKAYYKCFSFGEDRADLRAGNVLANYLNSKLPSNSSTEFKKEWFIRYMDKPVEQTPEQINESIDKLFGGLVDNGSKNNQS